MTPTYEQARAEAEESLNWPISKQPLPGDFNAGITVRTLRALLSGPPEPSEEEVAAIQVAKQRLKIWDGYGGFNTPESVIDQANGVADALRAVLALFRSRING